MNHLSKYKEFLKEFDDFKKEHEKKINVLFLDLLNRIKPIALKIKDILDFYEAEGTHVRVGTHNWTVLSIRDEDPSRNPKEEIKIIQVGKSNEPRMKEEFLSGEIYITIFFTSDNETTVNIKKRIESEFSEELKINKDNVFLQYKVNILSL